MSTHKPYRDQLVQYIKDAGQELIDRAEDMVSDNTDLISNFSINIDFDQAFNSLPTISWRTEVVCKNTADRIMGIENEARKENEK